ncbi:metallophosphoesterase family protein [Halorubrum vacuolatum]|uniref:Phosphoesterase n=1 Tax=Halorubrum vacuolatum TaxID=63740 RepID=A0A238Y9W3_HALVU|nr:metallophosphoesterase family protein [Halorubrum vacuolatum]SNR67608.1 phosphoesterase, MJ0936 family [Halorubrum vacuolatum]
MAIGLISDIHANLPALEAVLDDMPTVETIVCAGDIVGYNPWPAECVTLVQEVCTVVVEGNHDRTVDRPHRYRANRMAEAGLELAYDELNNDQLAWLKNLPRQASVAGEYLLVHDHPKHRDKYVQPHEFPRVRPYLDDYAGAILGHTHRQHKATIDDRLIVNPGSVGQPRDGDNDAAYAVLYPDERTVDLRRAKYDVNEVIKCIEESVLPVETATRLLDGS